eukprot:TRINITY_DN8034_c0_g1_i1.p5 TRINITY_DN8034_c0_g1~~TRINITY_DN8034_c0_g1_i1.p5  ORF type:complete len:104 (+),score=3.20 TRINITY_DN8034_c0_g1_i1:568-879(+)
MYYMFNSVMLQSFLVYFELLIGDVQLILQVYTLYMEKVVVANQEKVMCRFLILLFSRARADYCYREERYDSVWLVWGTDVVCSIIVSSWQIMWLQVDFVKRIY